MASTVSAVSVGSEHSTESRESEGDYGDGDGVAGAAFGGHTASKVTAAKSTFEQFYANLASETQARGIRGKALEQRMSQKGLTDEQKEARRQELKVRELGKHARVLVFVFRKCSRM